MIKIRLLSILAFAFPLCVLAQNDEELLKKLEYDWLMAEFRTDTSAISKMMDNRFISIGLSNIFSKQQELDGIYSNMSQRIKNGHVVDSLHFEDWHARIYGTTAIVTFISVTRGKIKGVPYANRRTRMYDVWIKQGGHWKAVSSQVTPISATTKSAATHINEPQ